MSDENKQSMTREEVMEQLQSELRFPMADIRISLKSLGIEHWKCMLVIGDPGGRGQGVMMVDEGLNEEDIIKMIISAVGPISDNPAEPEKSSAGVNGRE